MKKHLLIIFLAMLLAACGDDLTKDENIPSVLTLSSGSTQTGTIGGSSLSFSLSATDPDGLELTYSTDLAVEPFTIGATLTNNGMFSWNAGMFQAGSYNVVFTVTNTASMSVSATVQIVIQEQPNQFNQGLALYNDSCERCHGPAGRNGASAGIVQCIDSVTFDEKINGGSMSGFASSWSTMDDAAVLLYLNTVMTCS